MRVLLDTNLLIRITETGHSDHAVARHAVETLRQSKHTLCLVPQILYEYRSVATRPIEQNGLGMSIEETESSLTEAKLLFFLLRDERMVYEHWERLVIASQVSGKKSHDARIVAAMKRHDLAKLLTFNVQDFTRYEGIEVIAPQDVSSKSAAD